MDTPRLVVFLGPTLPLAEARALLAADYRPPAAQGDLYRAARERPAAIGLVDGVFHHVPAVWHKEVLWALSQGIPVYGAASMGALRAAELQAFGMVGVGRIFEDYRDGVLEADDEVALVHGPAESGWLPLSEALVDLRATLAAAQATGVVDGALAAALLALARGLFYPERGWDRVLGLGRDAGLDAAALDALRDWLPAGRVAQKRADAVALLQAMARHREPGVPPFEPGFVFEDSVYWARLQAAVDAELPPITAQEEQVLAALHADPAAAAAAEAVALGWLLARDAARAWGHAPEAAEVLAASREFCARHGLADEAAVARWLAGRGLDAVRLGELLAARATLGSVGRELQPRLRPLLLDVLRWSGEWDRLAARRADA